MSCPSTVVLQQRSFNAADLVFLQKFNACDVVAPVGNEDGAETALVKALEETVANAVGDLGRLILDFLKNAFAA